MYKKYKVVIMKFLEYIIACQKKVTQNLRFLQETSTLYVYSYLLLTVYVAAIK